MNEYRRIMKIIIKRREILKRTRDRDDECHCNKYYYHHHHRHYSNRPHNINTSNRSFCKSDKCQYKLKLGDIINHKYKVNKIKLNSIFKLLDRKAHR